MSEKKPQSFRADPIFLGHLKAQSSQYGLSMSDLVVRYLKVAYKLHQKYPDILGLGAQIDLNDISEEEVRASASQALFSNSPALQDPTASNLLKIKDSYEKSEASLEDRARALQESFEDQARTLQESFEDRMRALQEAIDKIPVLIDEQVSKHMLRK